MIRYEYVDRRGRREMTDWPLGHRQRRALNRKLDILKQVDRRQALRVVVFKVKGPGLYKIKVTGNVQIRPRLCFGPLASEVEVVTLLQRVDKKDGQESPSKEASVALCEKKIREIRAEPERCRAEIKGD